MIHGVARFLFFLGLLCRCVSTAGAEAPRFTLTPGTSNTVISAEYSRDGQRVLIGGTGTCLLWDIPSGSLIRAFPGMQVFVIARFSPDERQVLAGDYEGNIRLFETATGRLLYARKAHKHKTLAVAFARDGRTFLTGGDSEAILWDTQRGTVLKRFPSPASNTTVESAVFDPEERRIITGGLDGKIYLWDIATGKITSTLGEKFTNISSLRVSTKRHLLYSVQVESFDHGIESSIRVWSLETGKEVNRLPDDIAAFSPDESLLVTTQPLDPMFTLRRADDRQVVRQFGDPGWLPRIVVFSPDGRYLLAGLQNASDSDDHDAGWYSTSVRIWEIATGREVTRLDSGLLGITRIALTEDEKWLALLDVHGTLHGWNLRSGLPEYQLRDRPPGRFVEMEAAPHGTMVATGSRSAATAFWDLTTGSELARLNDPRGDAERIQFTPDGQWVQVFNAERHPPDGHRQIETVRIWNVGKRTLLADQPWEGAGTTALTPDARHLIATSVNLHYTDLLEVGTRREVARLRTTGSISQIALHPDGRTAVLGHDRFHPLIHDYVARKEKGELETPGFVGTTTLRFRADGKWLFGAGADNVIYGWEWGSRRPGVTLAGHGEDVFGIAPGASGRWLWSCSRDGTARLWDLRTQKEACQIVSYADGKCLVVAPTGQFDTDRTDAITGASWVFADDPYHPLPAEIFLRDYYEPHLLARLLADEPLKPVRPLENLRRAQPKVEITGISTPDSTGRVTVDVEVTGTTYQTTNEGNPVTMETGAYDLRLFRDSQLVAQWPNVPDDAPVLPEGNDEPALQAWREARPVAGPRESKTVRFENIRLPSPTGTPQAVSFSAYAFNVDRLKSTTAQHPYEAPAHKGTGQKRTAYLVCIGVNSYQSPNWNLMFAGADAVQVQATLRPRLEAAGYEVRPTLLVSEGLTEKGQHATKHNIRLALAEVAATATPDDLVLLFFSSHGYTSPENEFYLLPSDIGPGRPRDRKPTSDLLARCVSGEELSRWMRRIDAGEMVLIIDTCHSAGVVEQPWFKPGPLGSRGLGQLAYDKRMRVLAASQTDNVAIEDGELRQGLLTYVLTREGLQLKGADHRPADGRIGLSEWLSYAVKRVPELHEALENKAPVPSLAASPTQARGIRLVAREPGGAPEQARDLALETDAAPSAGGEAPTRKPSYQTPQLFDYGRSDSDGPDLANLP